MSFKKLHDIVLGIKDVTYDEEDRVKLFNTLYPYGVVVK